VDTPSGSLRLTVRTPDEARQRPRRDRHGTEAARITADELAAVLEARTVL